LSWDEALDNDHGGAVSRADAVMASVLRDRGNPGSSGMSVPPDMVQFSTNTDGTQQYQFLQSNGCSTSPSQPSITNTDGLNSTVTNLQGQNSSNSGNITLQLPLPTPISSFGQEQQQQDQSGSSQGQTAALPSSQSQQDQQQAQQQQQFLAQNTANIAQIFAQQAGNMFHPQQQMRMAMPNLQTLQQSQPTQQHQQSIQMPFTTDPNMFLQQLQFAQFQQQLITAQQHQMQLPMQTHFPQQAAVAPNVPIVTTQIPAAPVTAQAQPTRKRPKESETVKKSTVVRAAPKQKAFPSSDSTSMLVSASDTDAEAYRSVKSKKSSLADLKKSIVSEPAAIDTSNMTEEEKVVANRDRNREHARNTRLRKKAYLEKLKATVDELCRERDSLVTERASSANLLVEMHNTRTEVLMSFFALRTSNEKRRKLWSSILDESCFVCVMPVTPYRSFPASEVQVSKCQRMIVGVDGMMADTASLHVLLSALVDRRKHPYGKINFRYTLVTEEAVVAGNQIMARWVMTTTDAVKYGAKMEVSKQGMLCCRFNSAHKIVGLELMFDVMAFMLQLKQATGADGFSVVPNTVQTCQRAFDRPMVITLSEPPYTIIQVNDLWSEMTGYDAKEVVGKTSCSLIQAPEMDKSCLESMMNEVRQKRSASGLLVNVAKSGEIFSNFLVVFPLSTDSRISYYLGLSMYNFSGKPVLPEENQFTDVAASLTTTQSSSNENVATVTSEDVISDAGAHSGTSRPLVNPVTMGLANAFSQAQSDANGSISLSSAASILEETPKSRSMPDGM
jgi:PAS domain S-box-containing protein